MKKNKLFRLLAIFAATAATATLFVGCKTNDTPPDDPTPDPDPVHTHSYQKSDEKGATCTQDGYIEYSCKGCDDSYRETVSATGHDYDSSVSKEATCTKEGTLTYACKNCDESYTESIPVLEHTPVVDPAVEATFTETGLTEGSHCSVCGEVLVKQEVTDILTHEHAYASKIVKQATCTTNGKRTYTCEVCGDSYSRTISALGHDYREDVTPATCTEDGYISYTCTVCEDSYSDQTPALGHDYVAGEEREHFSCTDGVTPYTCSRCGDEEDRITTPATTAHNYVESDDPCKGIVRCEYCKMYDGDQQHTVTILIEAEATCRQSGTKYYYCTACEKYLQFENASYTVSDEKATFPYNDENAHRWNDGVEQDGITTYTCQNCEQTKTALSAKDQTSANVSSDSLKAAGEIQLENASIALDQATLEQLGETVTISAEVVDDTTLEQLGEEYVGTTVYNFTIQNGENTLSNFNGTVTVTIPYTLGEKENPDEIIVAYLYQQGGQTKVEHIFDTVYSNGSVTFKTNHFSYYTVSSISAKERCAIKGHNPIQERSPASCYSPGYYKKQCQNCYSYLDENDEIVNSYTIYPALPHDWVEEKAEATCTERGYVKRICRNCKFQTIEETTALGHDFVNEICQRCGYTEGGLCVGDHDLWPVESEEREDGYYAVYECRVCDEIVSQLYLFNEEYDDYGRLTRREYLNAYTYELDPSRNSEEYWLRSYEFISPDSDCEFIQICIDREDGVETENRRDYIYGHSFLYQTIGDDVIAVCENCGEQIRVNSVFTTIEYEDGSYDEVQTTYYSYGEKYGDDERDYVTTLTTKCAATGIWLQKIYVDPSPATNSYTTDYFFDENGRRERIVETTTDFYGNVSVETTMFRYEGNHYDPIWQRTERGDGTWYENEYTYFEDGVVKSWHTKQSDGGWHDYSLERDEFNRIVKETSIQYNPEIGEFGTIAETTYDGCIATVTHKNLQGYVVLVYKESAHDFSNQTFELKGDSCLDGMTVTNICANCGKKGNSYDLPGNDHWATEYEIDIPGSGCGGKIIYYRCPCGENFFIKGASGCSMNIVRGDGRETYTCMVCGVSFTYEYYDLSQDGCQAIVQHTIRSGETEILSYTEKQDRHEYDWTYTLKDGATTCEQGVISRGVCKVCGYINENEWNFHPNRTRTYELAEGATSCTDGVIEKEICSVCNSILYEQLIYDHINTSQTEIDIPDSKCGGKINYFVCPCGEFSLIRTSGCFMEPTWSENRRTYTCTNCGASYIDEYYDLSQDGCQAIVQHTIRSGETEILSYTEKQDRHEYDWTYTLKDGATTCEQGVTRRGICKVCGYIEESEFNFHRNSTPTYELVKGATSCKDGIIEKEICSICNSVLSVNEQPIYEHRGTSQTEIDIPDSKCGGKIDYFVCPCGEESGLGVSGCSMSWQEQTKDVNGVMHTIITYTCEYCRASYTDEYYDLSQTDGKVTVQHVLTSKGEELFSYTSIHNA